MFDAVPAANIGLEWAPAAGVLTPLLQRCKIVIMKRTQIQIPEPLYREVARLGEEREWSVSEVFRRAAEQYVAERPPVPPGEWDLPEPRHMGSERVPTEQWRDLLAEEQGRL
jgi:hypothetical protein